MALPAILGAAMRAASAAAPAAARVAGSSAASAGESAVAARNSARAFAQLNNQLQQTDAAAQRTAHFIGNLAAMLTGKMVKALSAWVGAIKSAAEPIENMVRVHNPAIADQFMLAITDAFGVIGRLLVPVMNAFTGVARKVGDVMAGLEPTFRPAIDMIAKLVGVFGDELFATIKNNAPILEFLAHVVESVATAAIGAVRAIGMLVRVLGDLARPILRLFGFKGDSFNKDASGRGAAARTARFVQPKEIADDAIRNAMMVGRDKQKTPEQALNSIDKNIDDILGFLRDRWGKVEERAEQARNVGMTVAPAPTLAIDRAVRWAMGK